MKRLLTRLLGCTLLLSCFVLLPGGCDTEGQKRYHAEFLTLFDTVTRIVGYADSEEAFTRLAEQIYDKLQEYHQLYDIYNDYEDVTNIKTLNDSAGQGPVKVDGRILSMLQFSKEQYAQTGGKVNVAFGAVLQIWHSYREQGIDDPENAVVPPHALLEEAAAHTDISALLLDAEASTVTLSDPLMRLDVGAVAKGYATEMTARYFEEAGVKNLLISVGGNVRAIGGKLEEQDGEPLPWIIGIQNPDKTAENPELLHLALQNCAVVSSGTYERYYTVDNVRYHHIIDPETLMPARYCIALTVISPDSGIADALSTALFNMPLEEGRAFVETQTDMQAVWVFEDGSLAYSTGFEAYITSA